LRCIALWDFLFLGDFWAALCCASLTASLACLEPLWLAAIYLSVVQQLSVQRPCDAVLNACHDLPLHKNPPPLPHPAVLKKDASLKMKNLESQTPLGWAGLANPTQKPSQRNAGKRLACEG
jgi:hypothetical protein